MNIYKSKDLKQIHTRGKFHSIWINTAKMVKETKNKTQVQVSENGNQGLSTPSRAKEKKNSWSTTTGEKEAWVTDKTPEYHISHERQERREEQPHTDTHTHSHIPRLLKTGETSVETQLVQLSEHSGSRFTMHWTCHYALDSHRLWFVHNSTAWLLTGTRNHDHMTLVLVGLHWLPICFLIGFKILLLTFT